MNAACMCLFERMRAGGFVQATIPVFSQGPRTADMSYVLFRLKFFKDFTDTDMMSFNNVFQPTYLPLLRYGEFGKYGC